jgi:hypothetical protein
MKALFLFTLLSISFLIKGQSLEKNSTLNVVTIHKADQTSNSRDGGYYTTYKPVDTSINGHVYAFNTFSNKGVIMNNYGKQYNINNINVDLDRNVFLSKLSKDSVYVYNNLKNVSINSNMYQIIDNKILKTIHLSENFKIYEFLSKKIKEKKINKVTGMVISDREWVLEKKYFYSVTDSNSLKEVKLNKRSFLKLFNKSIRNRLKNYAKVNNLSFRDVNDIANILKFKDSF